MPDVHEKFSAAFNFIKRTQSTAEIPYDAENHMVLNRKYVVPKINVTTAFLIK
jgi:hypothetical protein